MTKIAEVFQGNVQTIIQSNLTIQKKHMILESISEQLSALCDQRFVPDLTDKDRTTLRKIYVKTQMAVHDLNNTYYKYRLTSFV